MCGINKLSIFFSFFLRILVCGMKVHAPIVTICQINDFPRLYVV